MPNKRGWLSSVSGSQAERLNEIAIQHKSTAVLVGYYSRSVQWENAIYYRGTGASCHTLYSSKSFSGWVYFFIEKNIKVLPPKSPLEDSDYYYSRKKDSSFKTLIFWDNMPQQPIMLSQLNCHHGNLETISYSLDLQEHLKSKMIMKHKMIQQ